LAISTNASESPTFLLLFDFHQGWKVFGKIVAKKQKQKIIQREEEEEEEIVVREGRKDIMH